MYTTQSGRLFYVSIFGNHAICETIFSEIVFHM